LLFHLQDAAWTLGFAAESQQERSLATIVENRSRCLNNSGARADTTGASREAATQPRPINLGVGVRGLGTHACKPIDRKAELVVVVEHLEESRAEDSETFAIKVSFAAP